MPKAPEGEIPVKRFCPEAIGNQAKSQKANAPHVSLSKCTREHRKKVFISKEASKGVIPDWTPGAIYDVTKSTLNLETGAIHNSDALTFVFGVISIDRSVLAFLTLVLRWRR